VSPGGFDTSVIDLVPPPEVTRLEPGDYVVATIEHLVIPQFARDYYGPGASLREALQRDENTWHMVHREAVGNDLPVEVTEGTLERVRSTLIRAAEGTHATFAITGGLGYVPVTITGLTGYAGPVLERQEADGAWRAVDQSVHGRDFWQTGYDAALREWQVTYTLPADAGRTQRFRFRVPPAR
jgi:hypothetical protein